MATRTEAMNQRVPAMRTVRDLLQELPVSVGIMRMDDGWGLKINLQSDPQGVDLPPRIGDVPALFYVTGRVVPLVSAAGHVPSAAPSPTPPGEPTGH